jgi:hypothetical protein
MKIYAMLQNNTGFEYVSLEMEGAVQDDRIVIPFASIDRADECLRLAATQVRKVMAPETWGVWKTECKICNKPMTIVATVHSVKNGYAEMLPNDAICSECKGELG